MRRSTKTSTSSSGTPSVHTERLQQAKRDAAGGGLEIGGEHPPIAASDEVDNDLIALTGPEARDTEAPGRRAAAGAAQRLGAHRLIGLTKNQMDDLVFAG